MRKEDLSNNCCCLPHHSNIFGSHDSESKILKQYLIRGTKNPFEDYYDLGDEITAGAFGVIYKTRRSKNKDRRTSVGNTTKEYSSDALLAVKILSRCGSRSDDLKTMYEASILHELTQQNEVPNVIQFIDFYMNNELIYIVQELAQGGDVCEKLASKGKYKEHEARKLMKNLFTTLQYLHNDHNIVHRDLKLENLLLKDETDDTQILLCDFGEAKALSDCDSRLTSMCGTPGYTAPEILTNQEYHVAVDLWSAGCILYALLCGYLPFGGVHDEDQDLVMEKSIHADYSFTDDKAHQFGWDTISGSAKLLISNLLTVDPSSRLTSAEALKSNWFIKAKPRRNFFFMQNRQDSPTTLSIESYLDDLDDNDVGFSSGPMVSLKQPQDELQTIKAQQRFLPVVTLKKEQQHTPSQQRKMESVLLARPKTGVPSSEQRTKLSSYPLPLSSTFKVLSSTSDRGAETSPPCFTSQNTIAAANIFDKKNRFKFTPQRQKHSKISLSTSTSTINPVPQILDSSAKISSAKSSTTVTLEQLQNRSVPGLDYKNGENYLSDNDFKLVFNGATRAEVTTWKSWRIIECKRKSKIW